MNVNDGMMLSIRNATKKDARVAWEIRNSAIINQCIDHYPTEALKIWTDGELSESFAMDVENHFYVAVYKGHVVGTGMIDIETGKLDAIFVQPDHMRKGIGRNMVDHLEGIKIRYGLVTLTLDSTLNAASFYRACGFHGNKIDSYESPRGVSLEWIPMVKVISPNKAISSTARLKNTFARMLRRQMLVITL